MSFKEFYIKENESEFDFEYFKSLSHFSKQLLYAKGKLKKLGAGSSRIVFEYKNDVLKIAKNKKGIAQNKIETDNYIHQSHKNIVCKLLEEDKECNWLLVQKANKINNSRFEKLANIKFETFCGLLTKWDKQKNGKLKLTNEESEMLYGEEDTFLQQLVNLISNFDFIVNDFKKLTSFGEINNRIVVVDFGFTESVYKEHYKR